MKKNGKIIAAVVVLVILGVGGYLFMNQNKTSQGTEGNSATTGNDGNVFTSIKDALSKSVSLKCEFEEEGRKTTAYIKNGAIRSDVAGAKVEENASMIFKGDKFYVWTESPKQGFVMTVNPEDMDSTDENVETGDIKGMMEAMEKYKDSCVPSLPSDSLFTPPTDVSFQDMSRMMEDLMAPTGGQIDPEQMEELMKKYSNPQN